ncbi:MAG: 3'-5' exoribonuclease, partial [Gallicola sp.]|nr:3'-5' exoribonuclease [Gallicola sp.]
MIKTNEIIFDFETLSQDALEGVAVDCSFFLFDRSRFISDNPYTLKSAADVLKLKLSVVDQVKNYKWTISQDTLDWWKKQSPEAQKKIQPTDKDISVSEFAEKVLQYATSNGKINYWWSRSNTFDPIFLQRIMSSTGNSKKFAKAFPFWAVRDTRTW